MNVQIEAKMAPQNLQNFGYQGKERRKTKINSYRSIETIR
jgi:hypothetical protein